MTKLWSWILVVVAVGLALVPAPYAAADCQPVETVTYVGHVVVVTTGMECTPDTEAVASEGDEPVWTPAGQGACVMVALMLGNDPDEYCQEEAAEEEIVITPGMVAAALRRVPIPPSELLVQPPNGRTLVNFDTNFYTETEPLDRTLRLLGQRVDLRIWPTTYHWRFGDGATSTTQSAGSPYPDLEITHSYTAEGGVAPAVDTTYAAEFRVNGGQWQPVPGTVTIPGDAVTLDVLEATPTLVGYR